MTDEAVGKAWRYFSKFPADGMGWVPDYIDSAVELVRKIVDERATRYDGPFRCPDRATSISRALKDFGIDPKEWR